MAWSRIQGVGSDPASQTTTNVTLNNVGAGHLILAYSLVNSGAPTISDGSNTYTQIDSYTAYQVQSIHRAIAGASGNVTVTVTGPTGPVGLYVEEWSFVGGTPHASAVAEGNSGSTSLSVGPIAFAGNGLAVAIVGANGAGGMPGAVTPGAGYSLGANFAPATGMYGLYTLQNGNTTTGSESPSITSAANSAFGMVGVVFSEVPTKATLAGPVNLTAGTQSSGYTVTLDATANAPIVVNLSSSVSGDTFQALSGAGSNVTSITIPAGSMSGTFYTTPSNVSGNRSITIALNPALPVTGSPVVANVPTVVVSATSYTFTGPVGGVINATSTPFSVTPNGIYTGTVTIGISGGGLTLPTTLTWSGTSDAKAFAISPIATGIVTLTPTNSGGLSNPAPLSYHVAAAASIWTYRSSVSGFASGLSTVAYVVVAHDNSFPNGAAWVNTGVSELMGPHGTLTGIYAADVGLPLSGNYHILWSDGGTPPRFATDDRVPTGVEPSGFNMSQALSLILAATANLVSGFVANKPSNPIFLDPSGSTPRITGVSDVLGNRTSVDLSPPV